mgnify:CR=1 FL=1
MSPKPKRAVHLLWGEDAFLLREAASALLEDGLQITEVEAGEWRGGELADLATPSLFGDRRALVVTDCRSLPDEGMQELTRYLAAPDPETPLVLLLTVAERGRVPAAWQKLLQDVADIEEVAVARRELPGWIVRRARAKGIDLDGPAAAALVEVLGEDPATLASAVEQLGGAFPGQRIGADAVRSQFRGLGEQKTWNLCDNAFSRDLAAAMRSLRSVREGGDAGLQILAVVAARIRDLLKVKAVPEQLSDADAARAAGLRFDWQARAFRRQAARFTEAELVEAHARVVEADRALKSGADEDVILSLLVAGIARGDAA